MTELEKLDAGLPYHVNDPEVDARKLHAVKGCQALDAIDVTDGAEKEKAIRALFGKVGKNPNVLTGFHCDNGLNIEVGDDFLANYNVTILDISKVVCGNNVWIGPNTLICTVNHPLNPAGRRKHLGISRPIHIGNDVWIGGNATILPGVTIGNNVVVAAGAVVTKDIPDNTLVGGVPAKKIRDLENDIEEGSCKKMKKFASNTALCVQPVPKTIVSCRGRDGRNNALVVGFTANASLDPVMAMVGIVPSRFSHQLVKESGCFVINLPAKGFEKEYNYLGSKSGRDGDKFAALDLKWEDAKYVDAPILTDCPVSIECSVVDSIKPGTHELFIGKVEAVHVDEEYLDEKGNILWNKINLM